MEKNKIVEAYQQGKIVLINKPLKWTSFDVVNKVRWHLTRALGLKKIKVGHAGTLDPLADGLLVLCTGKATKMIEAIQDTTKEYIAEITMGATTPSYDLETDIDKKFETSHINKNLLKSTLESFLGEQEQMPPVFSAKKVKGKPAYHYARKQEEVKLKSRKVNFHEIELMKFEPNKVVIRINCSKGTYIRSFAHDLGKKLDSGAYLSGLTRTAVGKFHLNDAWILEQYIEKIDSLSNN